MNPLTPKQIRSLIDMWADIHDEKEEEVVEVETTEESVSEEPLDEVNMGLQTGLKGFTDMVVGGAKGLGKVLQTGAQQVGGAAKTVEKKRPAVQGAVGNAAKAAQVLLVVPLVEVLLFKVLSVRLLRTSQILLPHHQKDLMNLL